MTREEEIEKASKEFAYNISSIRPELNADSFRRGAKWADSHPNLSEEEQVGMGGLGMIWQKKHLIEKACEWLKENIDIYAKVVINPKSHYPEIVMCNSFEKSFKKAMEE